MSTEHKKKSRGEQRRRCEVAGKFYYTSKKQALTRAARAELKEGFGIYVYKCDYCRGWHLTKNVDRGGTIALQGSDLFDFDWRVFANALASHLNAFFDRHGI